MIDRAPGFKFNSRGTYAEVMSGRYGTNASSSGSKPTLPKESKGIGGGSIGWGSVLSVGFGLMDYKDARDEGAGVGEALASAGMNFLIPELVGAGPYMAYVLGSAALQGGVAAYENASMKLRQMDRDNRNQTPFRNYTFVDGPQIYTMRQAGLALAQQSKYNLQQTMMGNEAQFLHR